MTPRDVALLTLKSELGRPYRWGGDDPIAGFDCSGGMVDALQAGGRLPAGDWSANGLWLQYRDREVQTPYTGCLVFFMGTNLQAFHVEMCLDDTFSIGFSGGNSKTETIEDAIRDNGYCKIRPFRNRGNAILRFADPFKDAA